MEKKMKCPLCKTELIRSTKDVKSKQVTEIYYTCSGCSYMTRQEVPLENSDS